MGVDQFRRFVFYKNYCSYRVENRLEGSKRGCEVVIQEFR